MPRYFSYAEQTAHYFQRPHTGTPSEPLLQAAAWTGKELTLEESWRTSLSEEQIEESEAAIDSALATGKDLTELNVNDFPLPTLARTIASWKAELDKGRGFHLVSGVPVQRWDRHRIEVFYWCLGLHLGRPGAQNPQGDLLGVVRDTGEDASDPFVRLYRTRSDIAYHCDAADVVGLLCLESAGEGGESRIASSVAIFNAILAERPDLAGRLFEPFPLDIRNEDSSGELRHIAVPPCRYSGQSLRTFYHSDYFRSAQRHPDVPRFTQDEESLLGLYEEIANDSGIRLDMRLEPGDIQWLSNHSIVHARSAYRKPLEGEADRELLRLWLSLVP